MAEGPARLICLAAQAQSGQQQTDDPQDEAQQQGCGPPQGRPHDLHEADDEQRCGESSHS